MIINSAYFFIVILLLAIAGFWNSYFSILFSDIDYYTHFHAITMLLWIIMLIMQAFLIRFKKRSIHKFLGRFSYFLVPVLSISLILLAHSQLTIHDFGLTYSRLYILFLQLSLLAIFVIAYCLAIVYRHSSAHHARYMICTSLTLIDPAVARIPLDIPPLPFSYQVVTFGLVDLILLILIFMERNKNNAREVFPIMLAVFLFFQTLNLTWTKSAIWDSFSLWFAQLAIT